MWHSQMIKFYSYLTAVIKRKWKYLLFILVIYLFKFFSQNKNKIKSENNDLGNCHFLSVEMLVKLFHFSYLTNQLGSDGI